MISAEKIIHSAGRSFNFFPFNGQVPPILRRETAVRDHPVLARSRRLLQSEAFMAEENLDRIYITRIIHHCIYFLHT